MLRGRQDTGDRQHRMTLGRQINGGSGPKRNFPDWVWHICAWSIYISYEIGTIYFYSGKFGSPALYLLFYALNIGLFYLNALCSLPLAFRGWYPYLFTVLVICAELLIYLWIKCGLDLLIDRFAGLPHEEFRHARRYFSANLWRGLYFIRLSTIYWSGRRLIAAKMERAELQNACLQQQLRPHLLFNMLSMIYESFRPVSESAAACVASLADVMRYAYEPAGHPGQAELTEEVFQLCNLVELNRLRFDFYLHFELEINGSLDGHWVPRLSLVSLTENIFQHGDLSSEDHPASVTISVTDAGKLTYESRNRKKPQPGLLRPEPAGLRNLVTRLNYGYPGRYDLDIREDQFCFAIKLNIQL